jgi:hypothetical protein
MPGAQECKIQASRVPPTADAPSPLRLRRPTPLVASSVPHAARRQVRCGVPLCQRPAAQHVASPAGLLAAQQAASPPRHAAAHSSIRAAAQDRRRAAGVIPRPETMAPTGEAPSGTSARGRTKTKSVRRLLEPPPPPSEAPKGTCARQNLLR